MWFRASFFTFHGVGEVNNNQVKVIIPDQEIRLISFDQIIELVKLNQRIELIRSNQIMVLISLIQNIQFLHILIFSIMTNCMTLYLDR